MCPLKLTRHCFITARVITLFLCLVYVDDIIVASSSADLTTALLRDLEKNFAIKDLGDLGIEVKRSREELVLSQQRYATSILERVGMMSGKPVSTPLSTCEKLSVGEGDLLGSDDSTRYCSIGVLLNI